jgi:glycosyltransferase involved in cell wall biosynthesis
MAQTQGKKSAPLVKALVIAPQPFFSPRGTPFSVYYRTMVKSTLGCKIDLLTYGQGQNVSLPNVRIIRIPNLRLMGEIKIGPSFQKLILDMLLIIWTIGLLLRNRYDFVHAHEEAVFFCIFLKPIFRFKLVYDMHSSLPQQLHNFEFSRSTILNRIFRWLEDRSIAAADAVITICPDLADYVLQRIPDKHRHILIENSIFDPVQLVGHDSGCPEFAPGSIEERTRSFLKQRPCVVYAGTLEPYQGIDILLDAFKEVAAANPQAGLVIIGGDPKQVAAYQEKASRNGSSDRVLFTGRLLPDTARCLCGMATALVSPRCQGTNTPLKVYEQLASSLPLVATAIYSHTQVLDNDVAILVAPEAKALGEGLIEALDPNGRGLRLAGNAKRLYDEKYSRAAYEKKMKALLNLVG